MMTIPKTLKDAILTPSAFKAGLIVLRVNKAGRVVPLEELSELKVEELVGAEVTILGDNLKVTRRGVSLTGVLSNSGMAVALDESLNASAYAFLNLVYLSWRAMTLPKATYP